MDRRKFFKWLITTLATATSGYGGYHYAFNIEPYNVGIEHIQIPIKHLPSGLDGFKIVQISDIHLYPAINIAHVHHVFNMANKLKPDVILLTGDYVTDIGQAIFELVPALDSLNARYGVFAIHGNHDLWAGRKVSVTGFWETNVSLLVNENVVFDVNSTQLAIAGVDDTWAGNPSLDMALDNISPNTTTILMAHEPDFADVTANDGRVHLQLSGHSHGGQVRLPFFGALILPSHAEKYDMGLYQIDDMWLYTSRGVGVVLPAVRFNCPPEISEITLVCHNNT